MDPRKIDRTCLLLAIVGIENQQKNSWRSLDCSGNGYLGVYEGGAGRVAQEGGGREEISQPSSTVTSDDELETASLSFRRQFSDVFSTTFDTDSPCRAVDPRSSSLMPTGRCRRGASHELDHDRVSSTVGPGLNDGVIDEHNVISLSRHVHVARVLVSSSSCRRKLELIKFFTSAAVEFTKFKDFFVSILDERIDPGNDNSKYQVSEVIFLIGNKSDLEGQRDVTYEEAKQFADEHGLMFVEASAKTGHNVEEAFLETAKKIFQSIQDGRLDLNAAESGVQHNPSQPGRTSLQGVSNEQQGGKDSCSC
ncbi:Ras-related protein Rab-14 [Atta colombica]|uniref:Ras-related protein Rab-14 n=1 Tax=Atta colombica TaxID=520822 RepID=A0A195AU05_9HYME|nr:Ras-related protein Rab-14 [Atta colombica]